MAYPIALLRKSDIKSEYGIPKSTLNRWVALGLWPTPLKIGGTTLWRRGDVEQFLEAQATNKNVEVTL